MADTRNLLRGLQLRGDLVLYLDDRCTAPQRHALSDIFLGRAGGETFTNYARAIGSVNAVRTATIEIDHTSNAERVDVGPYVTVRTREAFQHTDLVSCGITGHHRPGQEIVADLMRVEDGDLSWEVQGRCGFAASFDYRSTPHR